MIRVNIFSGSLHKLLIYSEQLYMYDGEVMNSRQAKLGE